MVEETREVMSADEIVGALEEAHDVRLGAAGHGRSHAQSSTAKGVLLLHARRQALPRLQQPADVGQHRPRRPARHRRHRGTGAEAGLRQPLHGHRAARAPGPEAGLSSRPATSTSCSSPTAAPRPTRTPSSWPASTPAARRSWPATAPTTAPPAQSWWPPATRVAGRAETGVGRHRPRTRLRTATAARTPSPSSVALRRPRGSDHVRGRPQHRRLHPGAGRRHQRHPHPARRLPRRACARSATSTASCSSPTRS